METLTVLAAVISAVAAIGAVWFAFETTEETRGLRREDRLARLAELMGELGKRAVAIGHRDPTFRIERAQAAAMLALLDEPLPNCRLLATGDEFAEPTTLEERRLTRVEEVTVAALGELAELAELLRLTPQEQAQRRAQQ